ncbi:glycosyltransferase family 2 protein [Psychroflexus salinarum]|uniref:Glycosyltransferase family 2 protein n=1 Tax=Psychroflexus salinarum TaxID=546024 RepID=A0ABW3GQR5_9FLAO
MENYNLTVIVPVYNEAENLHRVAEEFTAYIEKTKHNIKLLFINDGSKDESLSIIKSLCAQNDVFDYVNFKYNCGLSAAIKAGFDHVTTELTGYIDADLQTHPEDFELLLEYVSTYDLVTGNRSNNRKDTFVKNMSSTIANSIRRAFTNDGMDDTGCPLKVIKTSYAKRIPMFKGLHRFLPAMILLQKGKIKQVDVRHFPRIAGQAKFGLMNRLLGPLMDCFAYLWMKKKYITYEVESKSC